MSKLKTISLFNGVNIALTTDEKEYKKLTGDDLSGLVVKALTYAGMNNETGELEFVVYLNPASFLSDPIDVASVLVHEAVHVWQYVVKATSIGEDSREKWGTEAEAYAIQNISYFLMSEYAKGIPNE